LLPHLAERNFFNRLFLWAFVSWHAVCII
jgi:hypothetical protein